MSYFYIAATIALTVYGQLILKWQVSAAGPMPADGVAKLAFLFGLLLRPWVISAFAAAFGASITWMAAISRLELSHAYPFMGMTFVLVMICSALFFHEAVTLPKLIGLLLIVVGIAVSSR